MGSDMFEARRSDTEDNNKTASVSGAEEKAASAEGKKPAEDAKKPAKKKKIVEVLSPELQFEVAPTVEPEPIVEVANPAKNVVAEPQNDEENETVKEEVNQPTIIEKWRGWLDRFMKDVTE